MGPPGGGRRLFPPFCLVLQAQMPTNEKTVFTLERRNVVTFKHENVQTCNP